MSHRKNNNQGYLKQQQGISVSDTNQQTPQETSLSFRFIWKKYRWIWAGIIILTLLVYLNSLGNDFVSDDIGGIVQNPQLNNFSHLFSSPLSALRFIPPAIQYLTNQIFGLSPSAFRATNILFHLGVVTLVFFTISRLINPITGAITALLTGVHPIMTESVTWISGGGHSLYTLFSWISLLVILISKKRNKYIVLAIVACFMAITISEKAIVLPLILLLFVWVYQIRTIKPAEILFLLGPAVIIGLIFLSKLPERSAWLQANYYQTGQQANLLIQIPIAISSYLQLIFWPNMLTLYHSEMSFTTVQFIFYLVIFLGYISLTICCYLKNRKVFFWLALFFIGLGPTLTPFGVSWIVAERYVYFSAIGIFVILGIFFNWLIQKNKGLGWTVAILVILSLSIRTVIRNADWKNQDTLWLATARTSPSSPQNHNNLGDYYGRHGNLDRAVEEFKRAIELNPRYGDAYHNLGNTYQQMEKYDSALESFQKAIVFNPNLWQSYANIGAIYYQQKNYQKAEDSFRQAIVISPNNDGLYAGLGAALLSQNQDKEALENFKRALEINPENQLAISKVNEIQK